MIIMVVGAFPLFTTVFPEYPFTANNAYSGLGEIEQYTNPQNGKVVQFRWSGAKSTILFRPQWSNYYLGSCAGKQIITLHAYAPGNQKTTMIVAGITVNIDDRPRYIHILQCLKTKINITSTSSFEPTDAEPRHITFALHEAKREVLPIAIRKYIRLVMAGLVSMLVIGLIWINLWLIDRRPSTMQVLLLAALMIGYWRQLTVVSIEIPLLLIGCIFTILVLKSQVNPRNLRRVFFLIAMLVPLVRIGLIWWHAGTDWDITIYPISTLAMIPLVYQPYWFWFCIIASAQIMFWIKSADTAIDTVWWVMLIYVSVVLQSIVGYWSVNGWQNTINISMIFDWAKLWQLLVTLRIAIPPILLVIEYAIRDYPFFQVIYGWCVPMIAISVCMMLTISNGVIESYNRIMRVVFTLVIFTIIVIIKGTQNFFIYDVLMGFFLMVFCQLLIQQKYTPVRVLVMGLVLVAFDMMRPFTMAFTPLFVALGIYHIYKNHGWQRVIYFLVPCIIVVWHFNHIVLLGQLNWSNHAGYNICGAWHCPPIELTPEKTALNRDLWPYINTTIHQDNSQRLLHWFVEYLQANPGVIMPTLARLFQNNLFITRTTFEEIHPVGAFLFTILYLGGFVLQSIVVIREVVMLRTQSFWDWMRAPKSIFFWYAVVILSMFMITAVTEAGENYRWILGFALILGYLPDDIGVTLKLYALRLTRQAAHNPESTAVRNDE
jgi:hypothetical protein